MGRWETIILECRRHCIVIYADHCDDRNRLKPVYGKYVLSKLVSKVNNSSQISKTEGVIHWKEEEGRAYVYVCIEDK